MDQLLFVNQKNKTFQHELRKAVRDYFKQNKISKKGNIQLYFKATIILLFYFTAYFIMMSNKGMSNWFYFSCYLAMGIGVAAIGMGIMHDANHGTFSKNERVNKLMAYTLELVGGYSFNWKMQHNVLHHTFTNISGHDQDVTTIPLLRFSPNSQKKKYHKYQYLYAWFFYGLMTLSWITIKDFLQLNDFWKMGKVNGRKHYRKLLVEVIFFKLCYYTYVIVLPIVVLDLSWYICLLFVFIGHFVSGLILAIVFQTAHIVPSSQFPTPNQELKIENNWMIHQLETTSNFGMKSQFLFWFTGGLNFQIEHHLFPDISHIHYRSISKIVKQKADEYGIKYSIYKSLFSAIIAHKNLLKELGK